MVKAVIDTNVLLRSINRANSENEVYTFFREKQFEWVVSNKILLEYNEGVNYLYEKSTSDLVLQILCTAYNVVFDESHFNWNLLSDKDDNKFVDLAISKNAVIITQDKGFKQLEHLEFPKIKIKNHLEFLELFK